MTSSNNASSNTRMPFITNKLDIYKQSQKLLLVCLYVSASASAQNIWTNTTGDSNWLDAGNWSFGTPTSETDAYIGSTLYNPNFFPVITLGQAVVLKDLHIGYDALGELSINAGSLLNNQSFIGSNPSGSGSVKIFGFGSSWIMEDSIRVGHFGEGTLSIEDRGSVSTGGTALIGDEASAKGKVTVTGTGSRWSIGGNLVVGNNGYGELTLLDKGQVINGGFVHIGSNAGSTGLMTVSGLGTNWNASTNFFVGFSGTGTINISNGAIVSGNSLRVAEKLGSVGTVNIGGAFGEPLLDPGKLTTRTVTFGAGSGEIVLNHKDISENYIFTPIVAGNGQINVRNGSTTFAQNNSYSGSTNIHGGTLIAANTAGSATGTSSVYVGSLGTLRGDGIITGEVTVDGTLAAGNTNAFGVLTLGGLTLNSGATTQFRLSNPFADASFTVNDRIDITNNLKLGGTLKAELGAAGVYRLFNYGGNLSGNFSNEIYTSSRPGFDIQSAVIDTNIAGQVNLGVLANGQSMQFWDGNNTAPSNQNQGAGGSGIWNSINTNWTNPSGNTNGTWGFSVGVFAGAENGQVTISGNQGFDTLQFISNGYTLNPTSENDGKLVINNTIGGTLNIDNNITTTINANITDGIGKQLIITGSGTAILNGENTYTGGTTVYDSSIKIFKDQNLGTAPGGLTLDGGILYLGAHINLNPYRAINIVGAGGIINTGIFNTQISQGIKGDGDIFLKDGDGILTLYGENTYTSETIVQNGTLSLNGTSSFSQSKVVEVGTNGTFDISQTTNGTAIHNLIGFGKVTLGDKVLTITDANHNFSGHISGTGGLNIAGGIFSLNNTNQYTGITTLQSGAELELTGGGKIEQSQKIQMQEGSVFDISQTGNGAVVTNIVGSGNINLGNQTLTLMDANGVYMGSIKGDGRLIKSGNNALTLSGINTYTGGTDISAGTIGISHGQALGTGTVNTDLNGTLDLNFISNSTLNNTLTGTGTLQKTGTGEATLTGLGSAVGTVLVSDGRLNLNESGTFTADNFTTKIGAITDVGDNAQLVVNNAFTQESDSELHVTLNGGIPIIANTANLAGTLRIDGFIGGHPANASDLAALAYTVIQTTTGFNGDFTSVDFNGAQSTLDYLTLTSGILNNDYKVGLNLTWDAGALLGDGVFTLDNVPDAFNVDQALTNQSASATGWTGKDLTKNGAGTLTLSAANEYSGKTTINAGTLATGISDAFKDSSHVVVNNGAVLNLNNFNQTAKNLSGAGNITLGTAALTLNNSEDTLFSGVMSGTGNLIKSGNNVLTLSGINTYTGGTDISAGTIGISHGQALGTGTVNTDLNGTLDLNFISNSTLNNTLTGTGTLQKTGTGEATLTGLGSAVGTVLVSDGRLNLNESGTFTADNFTTKIGAITDVGDNAQLVVNNAFTQESDSELHVTLNGGIPIIANTANLAGTLRIDGFIGGHPANASDLAALAYTVIQTTTGFNGDFTSVDFNGAQSTLDYLTLTSGILNNDYKVGLNLTWDAGALLGDGVFTLDNVPDAFNVDQALTNQSASATGWTGKDLTKNGAGTLTLSAANEYSGKTTINAGTLATGISDAFKDSSHVVVNNGAVLNLNNFNQTAKNLSGAGNITLGTAALTLNNSEDTLFSGVMSGTGNLIKSGNNALTLSGINTYTGGTDISAGTIGISHGQALGTGTVNTDLNGTLDLNFISNSTLNNTLTGTGTLQKTGAGEATLTGLGSAVGTVLVSDGRLNLNESGTFTADNFTTKIGAITDVGDNAQLVVNNAFTQESDSELHVTLNGGIPIIANTANLAGTLRIDGFIGGHPANASDLAALAYTVIQTTTGFNGDFTNVDFNGAQSTLDYLTLTSGILNNDYKVGLDLTWDAGPLLGDGVFTLGNVPDAFNVDQVLRDKASSNPNWTGKDLTKNGAGTLTLSAANEYSGKTTINAGTLATGISDAFKDSSHVVVNNGAVLNLNNFNQTAKNLSGAGAIKLGSAALTLNNSEDTLFSGVMSGTGNIIKSGNNVLTLSGINTYTGGTQIGAGTIGISHGQALGTGTVNADLNGTLDLNFISNSTLNNTLTGTGTLQKTGTGEATLTGLGSAVGTVLVSDGRLNLNESGTFTADNFTTKIGAITDVGDNAQLVVNNTFTQESDSELHVTLNGGIPIIANTANLAGTLRIDGFIGGHPANASDLAALAYTVIKTTTGFNGDFTSVDFNGAQSTLDYLTLTSGILNNDYKVGLNLTWDAGALLGDGVFTLDNVPDAFNVDQALTNQSASATGWTGKDLTKNGAGTLTLSAANEYSGKTTINAGTLATGISDAFKDSSHVVVNNGAVLNLNNFNQTAKNLSGAGAIKLGSAALTLNNSEDTLFSGVMSGTGNIIKSGNNVLTLSGINTYTGGTQIGAGTIGISHGQALGTGTVNADLNGTLDLNFISNSTLNNTLTGTGTLQKTGTGEATLTGLGSAVGTVLVSDGRLNLNESGTFTADNFTTKIGAITDVGDNAQLVVNNAFTQESDSELHVTLNGGIPIIANTANLAGTLRIDGFIGGHPANASDLAALAYTVIKTTTGFNGDFTSVDFNGAQSTLDYLTLTSGILNNDYKVGLNLTWDAGALLGDGVFTLDNVPDAFNVDQALTNQSASATGWTGKDLTKNGAGTLTLSAANEYSGKTTINAGTLATGISDAFKDSSHVVVNNGAVLNLNNFNQTAKNLSGAGNITLGTAALTLNNSEDTLFSGVMSGTGNIIKSGNNALTLSGINTYTGGTDISAGTIGISHGQALGTGTVNTDLNGTLDLNFISNSTLNNTLTGAGTLQKTGAGEATLTGLGSAVGTVLVSDGRLNLNESGTFTADNFTTKTGAITDVGDNAQLVVNNAFTQESDSELHVTLSGGIPIIANTANLAGTLRIDGFIGGHPANASDLAALAYTVIKTTTGFNGDFTSVDFNGAQSTLDYLTLTSGILNNDYKVGLNLTWDAGALLGDGVFTLDNVPDAFNVDQVLKDKASSNPNWTGKDLTKNGAGTLTLSAKNTYSGKTIINAGTLATGISDAFKDSSHVVVNNGAVLNLNNFNQTAKNLSGAGNITLGTAALTLNNSEDTLFSGVISGTGNIIKSGNNALTLSGINTYTGGTDIAEGTLIAHNGANNIIAMSNAVTVDANFNFNDTNQHINNLSGSETGNINLGTGTLNAHNTSDTIYRGTISNTNGNVIKTGNAMLTLTNIHTYIGSTDIQEGVLALTNTAHLNATAGGTISQGATLGGYGQVEGTMTNNGVIAVANALNAFSNQNSGTLTLGGLINNNGGVIQLAGGSYVGNTLRINGNYTGNDGTIIFNTELNGDASRTDQMTIKGDIFGRTNITVRNQNGLGALTNKGIQLIDASDISNASAFMLTNVVVAGAYEYILANKTQTNGTKGWYLSSNTPTPDPEIPNPEIPNPEIPEIPNPETPDIDNSTDSLYRPDIGISLGNQQGILNGMIPGIGGNSWAGIGMGSSGGLRATARLAGTPNALKSNNINNQRNYSTWSFISNNSTKAKAVGQIKYDTKANAFHIGGDAGFDAGNGLLQIGLMTGYGDINTHSQNTITRSKGKGSVKGTSVGLYGTWYMDKTSELSPYIDAALTYGWYNNSASTTGNPQATYKSNATSISLQSGIPLEVGQALIIEPQMQITYVNYQSKAYIDHAGTRITNQLQGNMIGRMGAYIYTRHEKIKPYTLINIGYDDTKATTQYNDKKISAKKKGLILEGKLGVQAQTQQLTFWGEMGIRKNKHSANDLNGSLGLKYHF